MQKQDQRTGDALAVLSSPRNNRPPRAVRIVVNGAEVLAHELGQLDRASGVLAVWQPNVCLAPTDIALGPALGRLALRQRSALPRLRPLYRVARGRKGAPVLVARLIGNPQFRCHRYGGASFSFAHLQQSI